MQNPTKIASFNELAPAETLVARLRERGIEAHVHDESNQQKWQLYQLAPHAHLQVRVTVDDEARATALLPELAADLDAVRCPECRSFRVEYPQFSRKTLMGALPAALASVGVIERDYYCEACHFTWPAEPPKPEPELDLLNWPKK